MDVDYRVSWNAPGDDLRLRVEVADRADVQFVTSLRLRRRVLRRGGSLVILVRHPVLTLRVTVGIYRRALSLLLTRVPRYRHPERRRLGKVRVGVEA
jgi:hypothetical protein